MQVSRLETSLICVSLFKTIKLRDWGTCFSFCILESTHARMELIFKKCLEDDLNDLLKISRQTFEEAFKHANNPDDYEDYVSKAFSERRLRLELQNQNSSFYFVHVGLDLVGYFKLNFNDSQTEYANQNSLELERIYVLSKFQGKRIGKSILQEVFAMASLEKKDFVWLGVWQENYDAIRFYEKHGFNKIGSHPYFIGKDKQTDWLMKYSLQP